jgi:hypothetical protein
MKGDRDGEENGDGKRWGDGEGDGDEERGRWR